MSMRLLLLGAVLSLHAETGRDAWLRYELSPTPPNLPAVVTVIGDSPVLRTAQQELIRGLRGMTGRTLRSESGAAREHAIVLRAGAALGPDAFAVKLEGGNLVISSANDRGVLYGAFALLRRVALGERLADFSESPRSPIRWVNEWNNLDGSIERGYGGRSIFWENNKSRDDLMRVAEYARLLASVGIQACAINNVNANPRVLAAEFSSEVARIADAMRPWGVRVAISVDFGSPKSVGGLDTFDPLDENVAAFWKTRVDDLYKAVPDL